MAEGTATCIDILLAIILPPLGVFLKYGCHVRRVLDLFGTHPFWISPWNYLCCLCYHQVIIIFGHFTHLMKMNSCFDRWPNEQYSSQVHSACFSSDIPVFL
ncbi:hypothetical protein Ahy_A06g027264 [Arachis hypogaea]|uniref:Uncharacterized protein n=1 Tax=Arachis hypogaea TaxID=3818 RepID=A0A445CN23_ARAHY|nr:hypothetical protein Ahy_A06g027264 [Arachis hypogaea]